MWPVKMYVGIRYTFFILPELALLFKEKLHFVYSNGWFGIQFRILPLFTCTYKNKLLLAYFCANYCCEQI